MIVYSDAEAAQKQRSFIMSICPARDLASSGQELPADWFTEVRDEETGLLIKVPREMNIDFVFGKADVSDEVGRYLVKQGYAKKSRLIQPLKEMFAGHER